MLLGTIPHIMVLAFRTFATPSSSIDGCDPASDLEIAIFPCFCSNFNYLARWLMTSCEW
jgi:hypothetical protein